MLRAGIILLFLLFGWVTSFSQGLVLNEIFAGENGGWIEFANKSDTIVNFSDYLLEFSNGKINAMPDTTLFPGEMIVLYWGGEQVDEGLNLPQVTHSETVTKLRHGSGNLVIDSIPDLSVTSNVWGRIPDVFGIWTPLRIPSPGYWNSSAAVNAELAPLWTPVWQPDNLAFSPRDGAGLVSFRDELWLIGGWKHGAGSSLLTSEIFKSSNGVDWEYVTAAPWQGRHHFGCVVFQDKIWVISGDLHSDVWNSSDGIHWTLVSDSPPWGPRYAPYVLAFNNKLWLMGGEDFIWTGNSYDFDNPVRFNDVWSSEDGVSWTLVAEHAPWEPRAMIMGQAVLDNKMWIIGGGIKGNSTISQYNDVWNSEDGVDWSLVTANAEWDPRIHHTIAVYNDRLWMLSGSPYFPNVLTNEIWSSKDGVHWEDKTEFVTWPGTHATSAVEFKGALWRVTGFNCNEAWRYEEDNNYYLRAGELLTNIDSWSDHPDGTGHAPYSFSEQNQRFIIATGDTVVLRQRWQLENPTTHVIVGDANRSTVLVIEEDGRLEDADLSVRTKSSVVMQNSFMPNFRSLSDNTTVYFRNEATQSIVSGNFFNVDVASSEEVVIDDAIIVRGSLSIRSSRVNGRKNGIKVQGDLDIQTDIQDSLHVVLFGNLDQTIFGKDTIVFDRFSLFKKGGSVTHQGTLSVFATFHAETISNSTLHFNRVKIEGNSYWGGSVFAHDPISKQIILSPKKSTTHKFSKIKIDSLSLNAQTGSAITFLPSDILTGSLLIEGDSGQIVFEDSKISVSHSIKCLTNSRDLFNFEALDLVVVPGSFPMPFEVINGISIRSLEMNAGGREVRLLGGVTVLDSLIFKSGNLTGSDSAWVDLGTNGKLFWRDSVEQTLPHLFYNRKLQLPLVVVDNFAQLIFDKRIRIDSLVLMNGKGRILADSSYVGDLVTRNDHYLSLIDTIVILTNLYNEKFLPIGLDSIYMPLRITNISGGQHRVAIGYKKLGVRDSSLSVGWKIEPESAVNLRIAFIWRKDNEPPSFSREKAFVKSYQYGVNFLPTAPVLENNNLIEFTQELQTSGDIFIISSGSFPKLKQNVLFYPNPTADLLHVSMDKETDKIASIRIINSLGVTVFASEATLFPETVLDLSPLPIGQYNLVVQSRTLLEIIPIQVHR